MKVERDGKGHLLKRLVRRGLNTSRRDIPIGVIMPLRSKERKEYPHIIYEIESTSPYDHALVLATQEAMLDAQFPIVVDLEGKGSDLKAVVRTSAPERRDQAVQSALFLGLTEATRKGMEPSVEAVGTRQVPDISEYGIQAGAVAGGLLQGLTSKPELMEEFRGYYGGLRWRTDQERFIRALFIHGVDFDPEFLDQSLNGSHISSLVYRLEADIPYEQRRDWYSTEPSEIFERFPELDYRRLEDEDFRATPEGQKLLKEYAKLCGDILADQNKKRIDINITKDGEEIARPQIPLSKHPIIEALVVDELSVDRPKPKYDFGPSDLTDIVLDSDSEAAHHALVTAINTRLPEGHRRVFDGPDEFDHKHRNIWSILRSYNETLVGDRRRELLSRDVVRIMDAFTGEGEIATSVREDNIEYRVKSRSWNSDGEATNSTEVYKIKDIVRDLIKFGITAPDPEIVARAEGLIDQYISENSVKLTGPDALSLTGADLMLVLIDALKEVSMGSQPAAFARAGTRVFGDAAIGEQLREFTEGRIQAIEIRSTPDVLLAIKELRKYGLSLDDNKSPEEVEARRRYEELVRPANQLVEGQRQTKNQLLLNLLKQLVGSDILVQNGEAAKLFTGFVKRVEFSDYHMRQLPAEYHALMGLANNPNLTERQRNDILWQMQNQFEYIESEAAYMLVPVVLDMYQVALGPVDAVRLPTKDTSHGLSAATQIVRKHGHGMFKSASQDQLETLVNYEKAIRAHAERVATSAIIEDGEADSDVDIAGLQEWQKESIGNLRDVMRQLQSIEEYYESYLRIEAVKAYPHIYYPWLLEQMIPFWQKMQWEVREEKRPSRDIKELYRVLKDHVEKRLVIREPDDYTEDFDVIDEGHVDTLIKECYDRMVVPHDIKYNTTVWQDGLSFMHAAVAYMPPALLERIKVKYPNSKFVEYLEKEHARWKKEEEIH